MHFNMLFHRLECTDILFMTSPNIRNKINNKQECFIIFCQHRIFEQYLFCFLVKITIINKETQ